MSLISHAQNHEDVLLWRVLGDCTPGFYIDVGAAHPEADSVTKAFYDAGWQGINIEPTPDYHRLLAEHRPRDVNLRLAVSDRPGQAEFVEIPDTGLSSLNTEQAEHIARDRHFTARRYSVDCRTLADICAEHAPDTIHFLKIDVEGAEAAVIAGADFTRHRPWVILVEAVDADTRAPTHESWEPALFAAGYRFAHFDGLNRYYVADEHAHLAEGLAAPLSILDDYQDGHVLYLKGEINRQAQAVAYWQQRHAECLERADRCALHHDHLRDRLEALDRQHQATLASLSWRITAPLRQLRQIRHNRPWRRWLNPAPPAPRPPVAYRITGHIEGHFSLAVVNRGIACALAGRHPDRVGFVHWHGTRHAGANNLPANQERPLRPLVDRPVQPPAGGPTVSLVHHYPPIRDPEPADLRVILFFWEETELPDDIRDHLCEGFDLILVASSFVHDLLRNAGIRQPIARIPLGIDHLIGTRHRPLRQLRLAPGQRFRFLHLSSVFDRKGPDVLLDAYFAAFRATDPVELVIKTFPNPHNRIHQQLAERMAAHPAPPAVVIDEQPLDDDALRALYRSAHTVVLPARGEGFNMPAAEALALGIPVIVTGYGGQTDFCTEQTASLIDFHMAPARSHHAVPDGLWAEPDPNHLARLMHRHWQAVLSRDGSLDPQRRQGARTVRARYTWAAAAVAIDRAVHHALYAPLAPQQRGVALISTWAIPCGIAEYAHAVTGQFAEHDLPLHIHCDNRTPADQAGQGVHSDWQVGDDASVLAVLDRLDPAQTPVILVQHQPSLFSLHHDTPLKLAECVGRGHVVVLELHSTRPLLGDHRISPPALDALRRLDRIVVHNTADLDNLLELGLRDNLVRLPLCAPAPARATRAQARATLGLPPDALVLATFGFLLPHKGVDSLVHAVARLAQVQSRPVHLLAHNARLDERSDQARDALQTLAAQLGIADRIHWDDHYRPMDQAIDRLAAADYVVFPYRPTRESASAAVTAGAAAGCPVLVSPQPLFDDLGDAVYRMQGDDPDAIVRAVCQLQDHPDQARAHDQARRQWLARRQPGTLSDRLAGLLRGLCTDRETPR